MGEFREFKNCKKKSEDFAGNNLIFYFFLSLFLGLRKPKFDDLTVKLKKRILKSLQVRTLLDLLPLQKNLYRVPAVGLGHFYQSPDTLQKVFADRPISTFAIMALQALQFGTTL